MTTLLDQVRLTVEKFGLLARGDKVVIAVSGGADSVALLHLLAGLRSDFDLLLHVAHLNHRLRPDAGADAEFVRQLASDLDIPATLEAVDVKELAAAQKRSLEDAGRQARYAFLERVAAQVGARRAATAHTFDDQIETLAMRLLQRGAWETLAGIPPIRPLGRAVVVRPLLAVTSAEVRDYLRQRGLQWREDPTNQDPRFLRNWVRLKCLPLLGKRHPEVGLLLWDLGELMRSGDQFLWQISEAACERLLRLEGQGFRMPLEHFRNHPAAVQRRMLRWIVRQVAGTDSVLSGVLEDRVLRLWAGGRTGEEVDLDVCIVRRGYDALEVVPAQPAPPDRGYGLPVPGEVVAGAFGIKISADVLNGTKVSLPGAGSADEAYLDAAAVGTELLVRPWRGGDRFTPLGMRGTKKLHDFFVDEKVPRWQRSRTPLVADAGDRILWVVGHRIAEAGRVTTHTKRVVRLRVRPLDPT